MVLYRSITQVFGHWPASLKMAVVQAIQTPAAPAARATPSLDDRLRDEKFAARRAELSEAALTTLATLGYARTSLREIAQNSAFSHGVLHYYFSDKVDLIVCSVRQYKARCVTRYDQVSIEAESYDQLLAGFLQSLGDTLRNEAHLHRLWYDLRAQALFEQAFRQDVTDIDQSLENMIGRVMGRFCALTGVTLDLPPRAAYALFDGMFQQALLKHLSGDDGAVDALQMQARQTLTQLFGPRG